MQIETVVRVFQVGIGDVLVAVAQVIAIFAAEVPAETEVIAKLKAAAECTSTIDPGFWQEMCADRTFEVEPADTWTQTKHWSEPDIP